MNKWTEKEISIQAKYSLKGTLAIPEHLQGRAPAVLFLHGSGNVDRNENVKWLKINAFKYLSDDLASLGFVALRYDKRGVGESEGNFMEAGFWDLVDDAEQALRFLKEQPEVDENKIILIGHSEGCVVAPALNARVPVQGMVLLAGIVGGVFDASQHQVDQVLEEIKTMKGLKGAFLRLLVREKKARAQNAKFYSRVMNSEESVMRFSGKKINAKWIREHKKFIVDTVLAQAHCPVLAITGSKDVQVYPEDTQRMGEIIKSPFEHHIIPDMNHLLRKQSEPASIMAIKKIYKKSVQMPLEPQLIEIINNWMQNFLDK